MKKAIDREQPMAEGTVAKNKVLPYLTRKLKWPSDLISGYGRVPVEVGRSTMWADFVFYIADGQRATLWLLVEVKRPGVKTEDAVCQAESYSLVLRSPFFCIADGEEYDFYLTGPSQGRSVKLATPPPIPSQREHLPKTLDYVWFSPLVDKAVDDFFEGLRKEPAFLDDTQQHHNDLILLQDKVFNQLDSVSPQAVKDALNAMSMNTKTPNLNKIFEHIDTDFSRVKRVLKLLRDMGSTPDDDVTIINTLLDKSQRGLHIEGLGIFFISQLLAAAHPTRYLVVHEREVRALRELGLMDLLVRQDTANGYVYVSNICRLLFERKMKPRLDEYNFGLEAVANFLFHYYKYYRIHRKWYP